MSNEIPLNYYIITAAIMFFAGLYGFFSRKNPLSALISLLLMFNAVLINFAAFNRHLFHHQTEGILSAILVAFVVLSEVIVALSIIVKIQSSSGSKGTKN